MNVLKKDYVWDTGRSPLVTAISQDNRVKTTQLGGSPPEVTARRLLIALDEDRRAIR
jgi:hypothetical protein